MITENMITNVFYLNLSCPDKVNHTHRKKVQPREAFCADGGAVSHRNSGSDFSHLGTDSAFSFLPCKGHSQSANLPLFIVKIKHYFKICNIIYIC